MRRMSGNLARVAVAAAVLCAGSAAQYPGQYPPGQYPSPYPGSRLPGGIPMPRWPKRAPKEGTKKGDIQTFEGTFRKLAEKELVLETSSQGVLKFRLLARTQFRDKKGGSIRDSLLKPGDQLEVEADAAKPIEGPAPEGEPKPGAPAPAPLPPPAPKAAAERPDAAEDPVIAAAREAAESFSASLPDYLVEQVTTRFHSFNNEASWNTLDVITADVAAVKGKEEYRNIRVNGRPSTEPLEKSGTWTTGEFAVMLQDILAPATAAVFRAAGEERVGGRAALVYD